MRNLTPIAFSFATTAGWGTANFLGGYASRRANPFAIATIANLSGLAFMIAVASSVHSPFPSRHALLWSVIAGASGGLALAIMYACLSSGRMGLVAPVAGVLSAGIPTVVTILREGSPGSWHSIGFGLAIVGVSLISRSDDKTERKALAMAVLAGCGFAGYALAIKHAGSGSPMWIEVHSRATALLVTAVVSLYARKLRGFPAGSWFWALATGLVDVSGSVAFVRASQLGRLDTAVVIASLHPAVTVLLAMFLLKEKLSFWKAVGVCFALISLPFLVA